MTAVADTLYAMLAKKLRGFGDCDAPKLYRHFIRDYPGRFCLGGKALRWASASDADRPRQKLSAAGLRRLATLAMKEGRSPDELPGELIAAWRAAGK